MNAAKEQNNKKRDPFSPLQTGCAFVMLTNLIIYLAVVAFVFNILDPSKLTAEYLLQRGSTMPDEKESEKDKAYRDLEQQRQKPDLAKELPPRRSYRKSSRRISRRNPPRQKPRFFP